MPRDGTFKSEKVSQIMLCLNGETHILNDVKSDATKNMEGEVESRDVLLLDHATTIYGNSTLDSFSSYKIPQSLTHTFTGTTAANVPITIHLALTLSHLVDKINVLAELPFLIRKFIQTFITAPFVYQWIEDAEARIEVGGEVHVLEGRVFQECTFLVEME